MENCLNWITFVFGWVMIWSPWKPSVLGEINFHNGMPPDSDAKEYCPSQNFNASCPGKNDVIVMDSARYGRMRQGRCVTGNYGNLGCSRDVLWYFDSLCSGRRRCKVYIADQVLHRLNPCQQELVSYLEAKYHCVTVATGTASACKSAGHVTLPPGSGYISSETAVQHGYGTSWCPWKIPEDPSRRIRLSLITFSGRKLQQQHAPREDGAEEEEEPDVPDGIQQRSNVCYEIGQVFGTKQSKLLTACGGYERRTHNVLYLSEGGNLTIQLHPKEVLKELSPFVLHYQEQGCQTPRPPIGGRIKTEKDRAVIGCDGSDRTWNLICVDSHWTGQAPSNCSNYSNSEFALTASLDTQHDEYFHYGILLVVAIGVGLGVLIGGILLTVVAFCMKRRPTNPKRSDCVPDPFASMQMTEESYYRTDRELDNGRSCAGIYEDDRRYRISPRTAAIIGIPTLDFVPRTPLATDLVVSHHDKNETDIFRATKLLTSVDHHNPSASLHHHNPTAGLHHLYEMPQITSLNNVTDVNAC